jgi:hypothetical protein
MKKVNFYVNGRRYEVKLEEDFALFVEDKLSKSNITPDKNSDVPKILNGYLQALKANYDNEKKIKELLEKIEL